MTVYAQYPYATLLSVGGTLGTIADQLAANDKGAIIYQLHVKSFFDANDDGIGDFRDEWGESIRQLKENIGTFGELSTQIGTMVGNTDAELAKAMQPGGGS